ncbi:MAG: TetR/AcrR family transcriptional regulator [Acidobacteriota bacterium]
MNTRYRSTSTTRQSLIATNRSGGSAPFQPPMRPHRVLPSTIAKRRKIVQMAMRHFAEKGYEGARMEDLAVRVGISKASIFQHFGSKQALFMKAYKQAVTSLPTWLDVPPEVKEKGFFAILRYWLEHTQEYARRDSVAVRLAILGAYGVELPLQREVNRFTNAEDPSGRLEFVKFGIERGEVRDDIDTSLLVSVLAWMGARFQDAELTEEIDSGVFREADGTPKMTERRVDQFMEMVQGAIGKR